MPEYLKALTSGFMPHGYCMRWDGPLLFVFISANLGIAVAYFLIPLALRHFVGKRRDLPYPHMFKLFAAFIMSCGITHIIKVWTIFQPAYWVEAVIDAWTAGISLITAFLLFPLIPQALALRSPKELEETNAKLQAEIAERKRAEEAAEAARDEAIKANKLKSDFVANVSHEIRTPMSGVIGMAELLTHEEGLTDETREIAVRIFRSSKQLLNVLNELLDFSKLEAGRVEMETIEFSPRSMIEDVVSLVMSTAQDKGLNVVAEVDEKVPNGVIGDEGKIRQVLLNLAHNAVKFTYEGQIKISVEVTETTDDSVWLKHSVTDTGIGIKETDQPKLFQPFVQADGTTKRRFGGTGLGLSIAKRFVELMKGDIGVVSVEGKGSTFWFTIPLRKTS